MSVLLAVTTGYASASATAAVRYGSILDIERSMSAGHVTAVQITRHYLDRIHAMNHRDQSLHAVIAINPNAITEARTRDRDRLAHRLRGPLEGIPILIKDNIETKDPVATTAGSLALVHNFAGHDAPVVASLRAAGAIILGKTNLSEWANFRSSHSISGWSAVGGLTRNPYVLDRTACGSSSGSAVAVAAGLAAASLGTETDGSITCPASMNGIVGLKPTLGLLSQRGIVPIAHTQDTAGPMGRSVADVALLLSAMTGKDYLSGLNAAALRGKRIGVLVFKTPFDRRMTDLYARAVAVLKAAGAVLIDVPAPHMTPIEAAEHTVMQDEFKDDINGYLATTPAAVHCRTLSDLIAFDDRTPAELRYFGQDLFVQADATHGERSAGFGSALATATRLATGDILRLMRSKHLDVLVAPTTTPAWRVDSVYGDDADAFAFTTLAAVAGAPNLTVPMGQERGLPVGLSFVAAPGSDASLLADGYAYEIRTVGFVAPTYRASLESAIDAYSGRHVANHSLATRTTARARIAR